MAKNQMENRGVKNPNRAPTINFEASPALKKAIKAAAVADSRKSGAMVRKILTERMVELGYLKPREVKP